MLAPDSVQVQESSEIVTTQLPSSATTDDLPIALQKGKHNYTPHPLSNFVLYSHLSSSFCSFISSFDSCSVLKNVSKALSLLSWTQAMQEIMTVIVQNET